jgi:hypothetical protein
MNRLENQSELDIQNCNDVITIPSNKVEIDVIRLEVIKSANCPWTVVGGTIRFCTQIHNPSDMEIHALFRDTLDPRLEYAGDFTVNGSPATPDIDGQTVEYEFNLPPHSTITICFKVKVTH